VCTMSASQTVNNTLFVSLPYVEQLSRNILYGRIDRFSDTTQPTPLFYRVIFENEYVVTNNQ